MREAILYRKLDDQKVMCTACARRCILGPGQVGFCGVRKNIDGKLYLLVYAKAYAVNIDPIEKKPLYHFFPGSSVLSIGTTGCNWACAYCCNYHMSQRRRVEGYDISPKQMVKIALEYNADGVSYTYNEPTIFTEYAHDIGVLARKRGLFNTYVTNGYMTEETVEILSEFLDAATVDIKGNADPEFLRKYVMVNDPQPIYDTLLMLKDKKIFIEITDLVIPEIGEDLDQARKLIKWIHDNMGPDTPIHFLRFYPHYKLSHIDPTPVKLLEKHYMLAREIGMRYVYTGNVPGHKYENTYCPECGRLLIRRYGFEVTEWNIKNGHCKYCGAKINIIYRDDESWRKSRSFWWIF